MLLPTNSPAAELSMANDQSPNYVMGKTREEYQRLCQQAQVLERFTTSVLDRIGVAQGAHCLDPDAGLAKSCASWLTGLGRPVE